MWAFLQAILIFGTLVVGAFYFTPAAIKDKARNLIQEDTLTSLLTKVPEQTNNLKERFQDGLDSITLSPAEQREKIITKLETDFADLKKENLPSKAQELIASSESLLAKLKAKNNDSGLVQTAVNKVIGSSTATSSCP